MPSTLYILERKTTAGKVPMKTETRNLSLFITNRTDTPLSALKVNWTVFASNAHGGKKTIAPKEDGVETVSIEGGRAVVELETKDVSFSLTMRHSEKVSGGRRGRYQKVDESGDRFHGYTVQILDSNSQVVGQAASHEALLED